MRRSGKSEGFPPRRTSERRCLRLRIADGDIVHAVDHVLAIEDAGEDPTMTIGPDRSGNLLEVILLTTIEDVQLAIHAMPMRVKFWRSLRS